jgi:hypothetical protein
MTIRVVTDEQVTIEFYGNKLDDADAWLQSLRDQGLNVVGVLKRIR